MESVLNEIKNLYESKSAPTESIPGKILKDILDMSQNCNRLQSCNKHWNFSYQSETS